MRVNKLRSLSVRRKIIPILSKYARKKKIDYFLKDIPPQSKILEVGCADGWVSNYFREEANKHYIGMDVFAPADIIGNILDWKNLGIERESFDVIVAFEVIEHVDCFREFFDLLKPGGLLMLTSPVPHMDWLCKLLEVIGLNQKRTSEHSHLIYFKDIPFFETLEIKTVGLMAQWGKFRKPIR